MGSGNESKKKAALKQTARQLGMTVDDLKQQRQQQQGQQQQQGGGGGASAAAAAVAGRQTAGGGLPLQRPGLSNGGATATTAAASGAGRVVTGVMAGRETGMQQQAGVVGALPGLVGASGAGTLLSVKTDGLAHEEERKAAVREGMGVVEFRHFQKALQTSAAAQAKPGDRTATTPAALGSEGFVGEEDDEDTALAMMLSAQMEADKLAERLKKLREHKKAKKVGGVRYRLPKVKVEGDGRCYARALAHAAFTKNPRAFRIFLWKKIKVWLPTGR